MTSMIMNNMSAQSTKDPLDAKEYTLANGLKVFISVNKVEPKVQTLIAVKAGSKFDPKETTGLAHYLEHLMFKGTPNLGTNNWEKERVLLDKIADLYEKHKAEKDPAKKKEIYKEIDKVSFEASQYAIPNEYDKMVTSFGAQGTNAYTSNDQTVYINTIPSNELEKWMKLEAERFQNLTMRLFHTELEAVYEEYNISQDNDGRWAYANLMKGLYPNHPYGTQTTIGEGEHLKNPSMVNIRNYFEKYYVPNNIAICLSGDINPEITLELINKYFGGWKGKAVEPFVKPTLPAITAPVKLENFGAQEEFVYVGFRIPAANEKEALKARVIDQIMANGSAGLIDINLVQKQKVLEAYSFPQLLHDYGMYGMYGKPKEGQNLDEVVALLLEQLNKFKKGEFEDWMIEAAINDIELKTTKKYESNNGRASAFVEAFTNNIEWKDYVAQIATMRSFTKKELLDFANQYFLDNNYVISYKRKGKEDRPKVEKPQITPVKMNRDQSSKFFTEFAAMKSGQTEPLFIDFKKEIQTNTLSKDVSISYVKNIENNLAKFCIILPMGTDNDKEISIVSKYMNYLGTATLNPEAFRKELFKNGLEISDMVQRDKTIITLSGLESNMKKGVELLYNLFNNCVADEEAFVNMKKDILKERENAKINKGAIFGALANYAKYGESNPSNYVLSNEEVEKLTSKKIIDKIHGLLEFKHDLFVYAMELSSIKEGIPASELKAKKAVVASNNMFKLQPSDKNKVFLYNYPTMVQAQIMLTAKGEKFSKESLPFAYTYNDYYGSGLSSIVFQELREQKALAYSAYSAYRTPANKNEEFFLQAFIGTQADKMPVAAREFKNLLDNMSSVPIQFGNAKESALKQIASDRIVRDNIFWQYLRYKDLGIDYDVRKDIFGAIQNKALEQFGTEFKSRISGRTFNTILMGDKTKMKLEEIKDFGDITELDTKKLFGF